MRCTKCGEHFTRDDLIDWEQCGEEYSRSPFMCPDCYDTFRRKDLEDQFAELMGEEDKTC